MTEAEEYAEIIAEESTGSVTFTRNVRGLPGPQSWTTPALFKWAKSELKDGAPVPQCTVTVSAATDYKPAVSDIVAIVGDTRTFRVSFVDEGGSPSPTPLRYKVGMNG